MKITCTKCGKRFDPDKHMNICPKCNHYHSQVGNYSNNISEKPVKKYRWETDPIELDDEENFFKRRQKTTEIASLDPPTYPKSEMSNTDEPDHIETLDGSQPNGVEDKPEESDFFLNVSSIGRKLRLAVCIVIGFVLLIGGTAYDFINDNDKSDMWGEEWETSDDGYYSYEDVEVPHGTPMKFDTFTVFVGDVCVPEYDDLKAAEGYKLIQINFDTESTYGYEDGNIWTDVQLFYDCKNISGSTYACYEDELTNKGSLRNQLHDDGLVAEAQYSGSYFWIFEVPDEVEEFDLSIMSYIPEGNNSWDDYVQDECFTMPLEI